MHGKSAVQGILAAWLLVYPGSGVFAGEECSWKQLAREIRDIRTVAVDRRDPARVVIGTGARIFLSVDKGSTWKMASAGNTGAVSRIIQDQFRQNVWYAAAENGALRSCDAGASWKRIFHLRKEEGGTPVAVAALPGNTLLCASREGIYTSVDGGRRWRIDPGVKDAQAITSDAAGSRVFAAAREGIYCRGSSSVVWEKAVPMVAQEEGEFHADIAVEGSKGYVFAVMPSGVYRNDGSGAGPWEKLPGYGLLSDNVTSITMDAAGTVYAAAGTGVFEYCRGRWYERSLGLAGKTVRQVSAGVPGTLFAVCDDGLYVCEGLPPAPEEEGSQDPAGAQEPDISEVHQAAIRYAEVGPEKIAQWRSRANKKAYLPSVNVGFNRDTTDLWHWESGSTTKPGDDCLQRGKDSLDWSVSLSWDLGELVWNNDQTGIDARSKLMVEMRSSILDEVTKIYFERKRVRQEIARLRFDEVKKRQEQELRLQELTALLDGLTGGFFSRGRQ